MKIVWRRSFIMIVLIVIAISSRAQKDLKKYKEEADIMRAEVWGWQKPEFAVREIPAQYTSASKVVIARHIEINADSKGKTRDARFGKGVFQRLHLTEITREAIKINDKAAVADYSEIEYTQLVKTASWYATNITSMYLGVRIINPDGTVKEINTDDIVLTKDDGSRKEAKLAIPDLQAGDIIDYFLAKQQKLELENLGDVANYIFSLLDDSPVMFYSIHADIGEKYAVEYRSYNGAPDFKLSKTEEDDNVFDMVVKNIPAYDEGGLWVSAFRQLPIIRVNIIPGYRGNYAKRLNAREPGKVFANPPADEFIEDEEVRLSNLPGSGLIPGYTSSGDVSKYLFGVLKNKKTLPLDSVIAELYYIYRYATLLKVAHYTPVDQVINKAKKKFNPDYSVYGFGAFLTEKDFEFDMVFVTPRSGPPLKEILSSGDINWLLLIGGDKERLMGISDIFSPAFYVPAEYENTREAMTIKIAKPGGGISIKPAGQTVNRKKDFEKNVVNIPGSSALQNTRVETINVTTAANGTDLQVNRRTILRGHYKSDAQKNLILFEDYCNAERKLLGAGNTMIDELAEVKNKKSYPPELQAGFDKARTKQKDEFFDEAKSWFEQPITDLSDYKIENMGVRHNNPDFIYSSKFTISGLIKKAGNNMILDIGKLQGSPLAIKPAQRKRKRDIYMPFARSLQVQVNFQIPDGYTAEGVNELNRKVENETGHFITEATSDGKTVTVKINKSYNHAFEPVGNWEKLLAFIDAANEWSNAKILLKKK